ncbi:MAG: DUF1801 domain-containing protein [Chloroflexi bacterium]|nr:DUF1801 domain-containing protein [Chloroflexota bacterium]
MQNIPDYSEVTAVFETYPEKMRAKLMTLRQLIYDVAAQTDGVGELIETLKWGQPSYLTTKPKSGTTIRIDQVKDKPGQYGLYVHCQTTLIASFRQLYPTEFVYEGNRAIIFDEVDVIPQQLLRHCIELALTYHLKKR